MNHAVKKHITCIFFFPTTQINAQFFQACLRAVLHSCHIIVFLCVLCFCNIFLFAGIFLSCSPEPYVYTSVICQHFFFFAKD